MHEHRALLIVTEINIVFKLIRILVFCIEFKTQNTKFNIVLGSFLVCHILFHIKKFYLKKIYIGITFIVKCI